MKEIILGYWEEYASWLEGVEDAIAGLVAIFGNVTVILPVEVDDLRWLVGKKAGILRTDDVERPIRVRMIINR